MNTNSDKSNLQPNKFIRLSRKKPILETYNCKFCKKELKTSEVKPRHYNTKTCLKCYNLSCKFSNNKSILLRNLKKLNVDEKTIQRLLEDEFDHVFKKVINNSDESSNE